MHEHELALQDQDFGPLGGRWAREERPVDKVVWGDEWFLEMLRALVMGVEGVEEVL